jgi:hypothetical protein
MRRLNLQRLLTHIGLVAMVLINFPDGQFGAEFAAPEGPSLDDS